MAAAAPAAEVDIPLVVDDDELYLAELFVEEAEREYMERSFMYPYTKEGQELRQIMSVDGYDMGPYKENIPYWEWVMGGDEWITLFEDLDDYEFDGVDFSSAKMPVSPPRRILWPTWRDTSNGDVSIFPRSSENLAPTKQTGVFNTVQALAQDSQRRNSE